MQLPHPHGSNAPGTAWPPLEIDTKPMRCIVACCWAPDQGQGISTQAKELAAELVRAGHVVGYLSPRPKADLWAQESGVCQIAIGPDLSPSDGVREVHRAVASFGADVVINNDHPYVQAALPLLDTVCVIVTHAMSWATASLARFNFPWADYVIALSDDMWRGIVDSGVPPQKVVIIPNGISDPGEPALPRRSRDEPLRAIFAGNWTKVKGADLLLRAISKAPRELPWFRLDCFGSGSLAKKLPRHLPWINARGKVPRAEFLEAMRESDLLLFPSRTEGCPMTVIEALAHGVVPLVSDGIGAMRWMIDSGVDGFLLRRAKWAPDMWSTLAFLNEHRDRLHVMRGTARLRYLRDFTISRNATTLLSLAGNRPSRPPRPNRVALLRWHRPLPTSSPIEFIAARSSYATGRLRLSGSASASDLVA